MAGDAADKLDIGLIQAELEWQDAEANRRHLEALMGCQPGCDLYVVPETFTTGFLGDVGQKAESMDGPTLGWMREQARRLSAAIAGSIAISDESGNRRNRLVFMPPDGEPSWYDKAHLFGYGGEGARYTPGDRHCVAEWRGWRIDLQVCYDLRFPVWCRNTRQFDLQLFVANWPAPRVAAWRNLLQARAIENQACVIGVNRSGRDGNDVEYPGRSSAWDAAGNGLVELGHAEATARATLSRQALSEVRKNFPFLADADPFQLG